MTTRLTEFFNGLLHKNGNGFIEEPIDKCHLDEATQRAHQSAATADRELDAFAKMIMDMRNEARGARRR